MSVKQLADQGYTTIFHPHLEGVTVHDNDGFKLVISKPPLLQGWREKGELWTVALAEEKAMNVYEKPSTKEVIRFGHAALGFPTKPTLLEAIHNKNLVTFPGMSADNVNKFFPECDNIHSWISLSGDLAFSHQHGIYSFKFPKRFLEISSRDLTLL